MEDNKTRCVVIDIYDADGVLNETVEADYDFSGLMDELQQIIVNEGVPVVRDKAHRIRMLEDRHQENRTVCGDTEKNAKSDPKEPETMSLHWKVNGIEFECYGPADDVKGQELLFRSVLADLLATTHKVTEGELGHLNEMFKKLMKT